MSERTVIGEKIATIVGSTATPNVRAQPSGSPGFVIGGHAVVGPGVLSRIRESCIYTHFTDGTTAGVLAVEGSHDPNFAGTWANIATVTWATTNTVHRTAITGVHLAIRIRATTPVAGGAGADIHLAAN